MDGSLLVREEKEEFGHCPGEESNKVLQDQSRIPKCLKKDA